MILKFHGEENSVFGKGRGLRRPTMRRPFVRAVK